MRAETASFPEVTGSTGVYLIVGDPIAQVRAPESFNTVFARFGIDAVMVPVHVAADHLEPFVRAAFASKNIRGMCVTIPHKTAIMQMLDGTTDLARKAGAVNAVRRTVQGRIEGALFDGEGFVASLDYYGIAYVCRRVLILGAGGAAAAIAASLMQAAAGPVAELAFYDPAAGRAQALAMHLGRGSGARVHAVDNNDPSGFDLVVNATPLGLSMSDAMPCDVGRMDSHAALVDILMKNQPTPAVRAARARGLVAQPGFEMMIQQTHLYLDFFGFADAAAAVRKDSDFLRQKIYLS